MIYNFKIEILANIAGYNIISVGIILKKGLQNTLITYFGIVLGFVNIIVLQPLFLNPEEIGLIRTILSISAFIAIVAPLGISNITIKYFSHFRNQEKNHHGYLGFMLLYTLIGYATIALILFFGSPWIIHRFYSNTPVFVEFFYFIFPMSFFMSVSGVLNNYCNAIYKPVFPSFLNDIFVRIAYTIIITLYFLKIFELQFLVIVYVFIYLIQLLSLLIFVLKTEKPKLIYDKKVINSGKITEMLKYGLPFTFAAISAVGIKQIDSIMLGWYTSLSIVGIYTLAMFIPSVIEAPIPAIDKIAAPKISDAWVSGDRAVIRNIYFDSSRYLMLLGGLFFLGIVINIKTLYLLLPIAFSSGINVVYIISFSSLFNMISGLNNQIIFSSQNYKKGLLFLFLMFIVTVLGNLILIPKFGIIGAAIATAIGSFIYNVLKYVYIWKKFDLQPFDIKSLKSLGIIVFTFLIGWILPDIIHPVFSIIYRSIIIILVFGLLTYFLKLVPEVNEKIDRKLNLLKK